MNPGILKNRIKVYRPPNPETDIDDAGQPLNEPIYYKDLWCAIEPLRGRQIESARQYHEDVTTKIILRYREDLDETMFAMLGSTKFEFLYILQDYQQKRETHVFVKEYKNG